MPLCGKKKEKKRKTRSKATANDRLSYTNSTKDRGELGYSTEFDVREWFDVQ